MYKDNSLLDLVDATADFGIEATSSKISEFGTLKKEYILFLRSKFDSSLARKDFSDVKKVLHHEKFATLYFARNADLITHFVKSVLASSTADQSILIDECSAGFRRVIFRSLFRIGFTEVIDSNSDRNPFEIAYRIALSQNDYQTAATTLFFYAQKVRYEAHAVRNDPGRLVAMLALVKNLYGRALSSLRLVDDEDSRWILNTPSNSLLPFADENGVKNDDVINEQKRKGESLDFWRAKIFASPCDDSEQKFLWYDDSCTDLITTERLERVMIVATCECSLAGKYGSVVNATAKANWRGQLIELLVGNELIDDAFLLGKAYPELNVQVFEILKGSIIDPNTLTVGEKVHEYLRRFGRADYYRAVLHGILSDNKAVQSVMVVDSNDKLAAIGGNGITIPWWLISEFLGVCPSELFKVLLEFGLFNVIDKALGDVAKEDIPYLQLEAISEALKNKSLGVDPVVRNSITKKIESLIRK